MSICKLAHCMTTQISLVFLNIKTCTKLATAYNSSVNMVVRRSLWSALESPIDQSVVSSVHEEEAIKARSLTNSPFSQLSLLRGVEFKDGSVACLQHVAGPYRRPGREP
eukprot:5528925-Amphidinium_carterae.1